MLPFFFGNCSAKRCLCTWTAGCNKNIAGNNCPYCSNFSAQSVCRIFFLHSLSESPPPCTGCTHIWISTYYQGIPNSAKDTVGVPWLGDFNPMTSLHWALTFLHWGIPVQKCLDFSTGIPWFQHWHFCTEESQCRNVRPAIPTEWEKVGNCNPHQYPLHHQEAAVHWVQPLQPFSAIASRPGPKQQRAPQPHWKQQPRYPLCVAKGAPTAALLLLQSSFFAPVQ